MAGYQFIKRGELADKEAARHMGEPGLLTDAVGFVSA